MTEPAVRHWLDDPAPITMSAAASHTSNLIVPSKPSPSSSQLSAAAEPIVVDLQDAPHQALASTTTSASSSSSSSSPATDEFAEFMQLLHSNKAPSSPATPPASNPPSQGLVPPTAKSVVAPVAAKRGPPTADQEVGSVAARVSIQDGLISIRLVGEDGAVARDAATHLASVKSARSSATHTSSRSNDRMAAATKPTLAPRYVSVTEAAQASELPRNVVSSWIDSRLVRSLKVGTGNNSKRIVDLNDVISFRDQSLALSMPRMQHTSGCRAVVYTRVDKDAIGGDPDAEVERILGCLMARMEQTHPALMASPSSCSEVGGQADLDRPGFVRLMAMILARELDVLIVTDAGQLCPPECMPLFLWILQKNHVLLHVEPLPPSIEAGDQPGHLIHHLQ